MRNLILQSATLQIAVSLVALSPAPVSAALTIKVEPVSTVSAPGSAGYLQIVLANTYDEDQTFASFAVDVAVDGVGVVFTGVDDQTDETYVFEGFSSGSLTFDTFNNSGFNLNDVVYDPVNDPPQTEITVLAGQSYGLGRIAFLVDGSAATGVRNVTLSNPMFGDSDGNRLDFEVVITNGSIEVQGELSGPVVPEPGTLSMFVAGGMLVAGSIWRKRVSAKRPRRLWL